MSVTILPAARETARYTHGAMALHWLIAISTVALIAIGPART